MSRIKQFMQPCPPLVETFSFRNLPCRFEQRSDPGRVENDPATKRCPEFEYCKLSSPVLWRFERVYGRWIKVTLAESSSSIVVRSEHHFNKIERRRLSLRKHIYELSADHGDMLSRERREPLTLEQRFFDDLCGKIDTDILLKITDLAKIPFSDIREFEGRVRERLTADEYIRFGEFISARAFSPLDCYRISQGDQFGHYIGFVDLRPNSAGSPLALAVLGLPRKYRHSQDAFIITGNYGPFFGGPSFQSTVYCMHDPKDGGAQCAQACITMALGLLADRGAQVSGSYTLSYLGKKQHSMVAYPPGNIDVEEDRLGHVGNGRHLGNVPKGESQREAFDAAGTLGGLEPVQLVNLLKDRGISACLFQEKVSDHSARLLQRLVEANIASRSPVILAVDASTWWPWESKKDAAHAVIVVGTRRLPDLEDELALITHDPGFLPFYERRFSECRAACAAYSNGSNFLAVFAAHKSVLIHAYQCIQSLVNDRSSERHQFNKYLQANPGSNLDYRIGLVVRDNLAETFYSRSHLPSRKWIQQLQCEFEAPGRLPRARYWCIAALDCKRLKHVWIYNAGRIPQHSQVGWSARLRFEGHTVEFEWVASGQIESTKLS